MGRKRHSATALAAFQGHVEYLGGRDELARARIEPEDFTLRGINQRAGEDRDDRARRILLWACVVLALLAVAGSAVGG